MYANQNRVLTCISVETPIELVTEVESSTISELGVAERGAAQLRES